MFAGASVTAQSYKFPFQNPELSFEKRVDDLVGRLTLEEKVAQMLNAAPAIPRLEVPAYEWWNETLHGVGRTKYHVTVFPQAIAMAATFDPDALFKMADYSAMEGRVIYNKAEKRGKRYEGLTYWTPNINIFRDPRWGRGQETYGEDPYLTGLLGDAFVRGLQGNDPKYLKAAACAKHFAVHSGPEPLRHHFNIDVSPYELWDTYLPAFEKLVTGSDVAGVMCAYNAFRTQPCCGSDLLMTDILRNQWKFKGYVTSDCGGIEDFFTKHKTHAGAEEASVDAVVHGTDVECGHGAYLSLVDAVKKGKISENQIDISVKRLFLIRFRLGLFDPVSMVKYAQVADSVLNSNEHRRHALLMARESMVLLKNDGLLPLSKKLKKLVVLGPNADNAISILGNYNGTPERAVTVLQGIKDKLGKDVQVVYESPISFTSKELLYYDDIRGEFSFEGKPGFKAEYFDNAAVSGQPVSVRQEAVLDNSWQEGQVVSGPVTASNFSARYQTTFRADADQDMSVELQADNGCRLWLNDELIIEDWNGKRRELKRYDLKVKKGSVYRFRIEYWQSDASAYIKFRLGKYRSSDFDALVARHQDADAFIFAGGISPQLEGESMKVDAPGFKGGDRTSIMLPEVQTELMRKLKASGKPVVFVMMTGSALATPWESENIPAILNAWYGGQDAGTAVADILFGDYCPSGRLPVTFYQSDKDLGDFEDYTMSNRTYRYFSGKPLYGFGYGLSYTSFKYDNFILDHKVLAAKGLNLSVRVSNTGKMDGDELVQVYLMNKNSKITTAIKELKAIKRVHLKAGESKVIKLRIEPDALSYVKADGQRAPLNGEALLSIGGCQPDESNRPAGSVLTRSLTVR